VPAATPKKSKAPVIVGALLLIIALAGGGWLLSQRATLSAADQLAKADTLTGKTRSEAVAKLATVPDVTDAQLEQAAIIITDAEDWDSALTLADGWLLKNPKSLGARLLEAKAAVATRKARRAETAIAAAAELAPKDSRPDALLAELREAQGDAGGALDAWTRVVNRTPNARALARQGYWLSQAGKLDEAEAALQKSVKKKADPATSAELGFVKYRKEQFDDALRILRGVVKEKPDLFEGHYYLAPVLFRKKDVAGARAEYLAADQLAPTDSRALVSLCEMEQLADSTSDLDAVKARIKERFPKEADKLIARCGTAAP
jgi:Flp pilus assembly protein TadD